MFTDRAKYLLLTLPCCIFLFYGCKFLADSAIGKGFHNMNAHYNVLFNANEIYKKVVLQTEDKHIDNYNNVLDVFQFGNSDILKKNSSDVDNILKKCSKILDKHPNSKWIPETYFLIGRGYFYKGDYYAAMEAFQYLVYRYQNTEIAYESTIWLSLCHLKLNKYDDAQATLSALKGERTFSDNLNKMIWLTEAYIDIKKQDYLTAIENLAQAIHKEKTRRYKTRYMYILGQLYQRTDRVSSALNYYAKVIKRNPQYEMAFNAKMEIARCYESSSLGNVKEIRNRFLKMLRDDKNIQYYDQIYFELALLEIKMNDFDKAQEYLKLSIKSSKGNQNQKAIAFMLIGEYYMNHQNYIIAKKYYDSSSNLLASDYPDYQKIQSKTNTIRTLLGYMVTVVTEDSLLRLASLKPNQLDSVINLAYNNDLKMAKEKAKREKELKSIEAQNNLLNNQFNRTQSSMPDLTQSENSWYFSNASLVSKGENDFYSKWGRRPLEDNWRRRKKETSNTEIESDKSIPEKSDSVKVTEKDKQIVSSKLNKVPKEKQKYYTDIPFTAALKEISRKKILEAMKNAADIYGNQLGDTAMASHLYESLLTRFPGNKYEIESHYDLYKIYSKEQNDDRADYHKNFIIKKYPESDYALLIINPDSLRTLQSMKNILSDSLYAQIWRIYQSGNCQQAIKLADSVKGKINYSYQPKLEYLKIVCIGKDGPKEDFKTMLKEFVKKYNKTDIATNAENLIQYLNGADLIVNRNEKQKGPNAHSPKDSIKKSAGYSVNPNEVHYFFCIVPPSLSAREIKVLFSTYNSQYFQLDNLDINSVMFNKDNQLIIVKEFKNQAAGDNYLKKIYTDKDFLSKSKLDKNSFFIITPENFQLLMKDQNITRYSDFFDDNYVQ